MSATIGRLDLDQAMALGERIPEGSSGVWRVERMVIDEAAAQLDRLRSAIQGHGYRAVRAGAYTSLIRGRTIVMSDTPAERRDHMEPWLQARRRGGRVLIHGLGLGMVTGAILALENVAHVDVVESSEDVLALVAPAYREHVDAGRLTIHHADCLRYPWLPGTRWAVVWHDIWETICGDNLPEMTTLHRKFGGRCDWQGSWSREILLAERRRTWGW